MSTASEQPNLPLSSPPPQPYAYPPVIIILSIALLLVFFIGFFSIYFCRCFVQNLFCMWHLRGSATAAPATGAAPTAARSNGLDPSIVQSFPSFAYSTVKDYRAEKYGLECAICLVEFQDVDVLRLLTTCCHVFHQECIDLWLESHHTCPVCRKNLASPALQSPVKSPGHENEPIPPENEDVGNKVVFQPVEKYPRSHSTGHSIVIDKGNYSEDRFTLILPQHVKSRILRGHHSSSKSWSVFGEYKDKDKDSPNKSVAQVTGDENV